MSARRRVRFSLSSTMGWEFTPLVEKVRLAEQLGFEGFYASDHMLGVAGVPRDVPFMEPWTLLAALAPQTSALRLGVLVSGATYWHPSMLAKIASTLDVISGGRGGLGLGGGWPASRGCWPTCASCLALVGGPLNVRASMSRICSRMRLMPPMCWPLMKAARSAW